MAEPYSSSFYAGAVQDLTWGLFDPAPAGRVYVLRDMEVAERSGQANDVTLWICVPGLQGLSVVNCGTLGAYATYQWQGRIVLPEGYSVGVSASYWPVHVVISGFNLG